MAPSDNGTGEVEESGVHHAASIILGGEGGWVGGRRTFQVSGNREERERVKCW